MANKNLNTAKSAKDDEFYTKLSDIENELGHYTEQFKGKTIFLNCDDPKESNFWKYFVNNFELLGIKRVISTHYNQGSTSYKLEMISAKENNGEAGWETHGWHNELLVKRTELKGDGDFRSEESIELLKQSDLIITNPPFSLFREYVAQLMEFNKQFLIIGSKTAISTKDVFAYIKADKLWLGLTSPKEFTRPGGEITKKVQGLCRWFTNLNHNQRNEELFLFRSINDAEVSYPKYDNYDAINVGKVKDIPHDYDGLMGVPITFIDKYNPNQFEIVDADGNVPKTDISVHRQRFVINGKAKFARILIRRRK